MKILWEEWKQTQHTKTYGMPQTKCSKGNVQIVNSYIKKDRPRTNNLNLHLKELEEQTKPRVSRGKKLSLGKRELKNGEYITKPTLVLWKNQSWGNFS